MAGLEVVVRPVIFPNIRPPTPQVVPPANSDSPFVLSGASGKLIDLPHSWSASTSRSTETETKRQFDTERVYQVDDNGKINKSNYVEVERLKKVRMDREEGDPVRQTYAVPPKVDNVETIETDLTRNNDLTRETFLP